MMKNIRYSILLIITRILPTNYFVEAGSFNYSLCAEIAVQTFTNAPNDTFLHDQQGRPTGILANAWGISYFMCEKLCGTQDNTGYFDWGFLSQGVSSWLLPWLALTAQLPFETKGKTTNFRALLLALGSPALVAYSLALTILNARRINKKFRQIKEASQTLNHPLQIRAIKAARFILIEMQHVPIQIYNGSHREISQLIVHPANWAWWCSLRQKLLITKRKWTYSLYAQVGWVCIAQLLAIIDFFTSASSNTTIGIGLAINSLWLWMIPIVLGWVYVGNQDSAESFKAALTDTSVPVLDSQRNLKSGCIGIRDRTTYDGSSTQFPLQKRLQRQGGPSLRGSAVNPAAPDVGIVTEQEHTNAASYQDSPILQPSTASSSKRPDVLCLSRSDETELQTLKTDRQVSSTSTFGATQQHPSLALEDDALSKSLLQTFMGFSIAGDELEPGSIFNQARVWTHMHASKQVADAFLTLTRRQMQRETVNGREWEEDPDRWTENLQGTPEQMSQYISAFYEDVQDFSVHARASADLVLDCITAGFVAVFLQWGTTGAAIVIAYRTPTVGLGCQSGSYLIYGLVSTAVWLMLTLSAYLSHLHSLRLETCQHRRPSTLLAAFAVVTRLLGNLFAAINAVFVVAISVIQFTGLLDNCWCDACVPGLGKKAGWVVLFASDAQVAAASKSAWVGGVFMGIVAAGLVSLWVFVARGDELFG